MHYNLCLELIKLLIYSSLNIYDDSDYNFKGSTLIVRDISTMRKHRIDVNWELKRSK